MILRSGTPWSGTWKVSCPVFHICRVSAPCGSVKQIKALTSQRSIVFNSVMQIHIGKIEGVFPVRFAQQPSHEVRYEETEGRCKVVCSADGTSHLLERNVLAVSW